MGSVDMIKAWGTPRTLSRVSGASLFPSIPTVAGLVDHPSALAGNAPPGFLAPDWLSMATIRI
jgi:hypothetical protein